MKQNAFKRAITMMQALSAAFALPVMQQQAAFAKIGEYRSRGKGLGRHSGKKWGPRPSGRDMVRVKTADRGEVWLQKENGTREVLRRQRQLGTLSQVSA